MPRTTMAMESASKRRTAAIAASVVAISASAGAILAGAGALVGCAGAAQPAASVQGASVQGASAGAAAGPGVEGAKAEGIAFVEDDLPAATARAKAEGKALFVDAWAPWCHTCLSMKHYVFTDPSLKTLADRVVFAAIDTDRASSAAFLEKHEVRMWPTFFVIDPATDRVVGAWPGSASLGEMRAFIEDSLATLDATRAGTLAADDPVRLVAEARAAHAAGDAKGAAALFERAAGNLSAGHARRSEVLAGWLFALYAAKDWSACAAVGEKHVAEVKGAAVPADFASLMLTCAERLPETEKARKDRARGAAIARLSAITATPPADASADDRADAWGILADALEGAGDAAGARRAREAKLAVLEKAAAEAKAPEVAATFDYARAMTYVELGRGGIAIAMLEGRERDMPGSYEPPARLASVLFKVGRYADAKAAIDRAIAKAYGPRKLGYLRLRAQILAKMGDREGALATLREEVRGYEALPAGQASPAALADAKKRLAEAEAGSR